MHFNLTSSSIGHVVHRVAFLHWLRAGIRMVVDSAFN